MEKETERCSNCNLRKPDKTCKHSPKEPTGAYDWCGAWRKKHLAARG